MAIHKNKHIRAAIQYATERGWRYVKGGGGHVVGNLYCPGRHGGCIVRVYGTPRVPENHVAQIRRLVDGCEHGR